MHVCDLGQSLWHDDICNAYTMLVGMASCDVVTIVTHGGAIYLSFPFQRRITTYGTSMSVMGTHECRLSN